MPSAPTTRLPSTSVPSSSDSSTRQGHHLAGHRPEPTRQSTPAWRRRASGWVEYPNIETARRLSGCGTQPAGSGGPRAQESIPHPAHGELPGSDSTSRGPGRAAASLLDHDRTSRNQYPHGGGCGPASIRPAQHRQSALDVPWHARVRWTSALCRSATVAPKSDEVVPQSPAPSSRE
eukprot:scaffold5362_cov100-Isochrysis_galbana.AAC.2